MLLLLLYITQARTKDSVYVAAALMCRSWRKKKKMEKKKQTRFFHRHRRPAFGFSACTRAYLPRRRADRDGGGSGSDGTSRYRNRGCRVFFFSLLPLPPLLLFFILLWCAHTHVHLEFLYHKKRGPWDIEYKILKNRYFFSTPYIIRLAYNKFKCTTCIMRLTNRYDGINAVTDTNSEMVRVDDTSDATKTIIVTRWFFNRR